MSWHHLSGVVPYLQKDPQVPNSDATCPVLVVLLCCFLRFWSSLQPEAVCTAASVLESACTDAHICLLLSQYSLRSALFNYIVCFLFMFST